MMPGDPIDFDQLQPDPDGRPWVFGSAAGTDIYLSRGIMRKLAGKLSSTVAKADGAYPAAAAEQVREAVEATLASLHTRTLEGVLTTLEKPPSIDYLCAGPQVTYWWAPASRVQLADNWVTVVVRRLPRGAGWDPAFHAHPDGMVHLLITITPRSRRWQSVLAGEPITELTETHVLKPGGKFLPELHCDYP